MFLMKLTKMKSIILVVMMILFAVPTVSGSPARQTVTCVEDYTVQSGDWLSTIAQKYYGEVLAYTVIVNTTNLMARDNSKYTPIGNPNEIEVGQVLCIPPDREAEGMLNEPDVAPRDAETIIPEEEMLIIIGNRTLANVPATVTLFGKQFGEEGQTFTLEAGDEIRFELPSGDYRAT